MNERATTENHQAAGRFLTITLGRELYAINALRVREIIRPIAISPVPKSLKHVLGVVNLRGKVLPVIDLRIKLDLPAPRTDHTCIVVVETGSKLTGLMVDEAREVLTLNRDEIEEAPTFGGSVDVSYVSGLAKSKESLMILLNVDRVVNEPQQTVAT
jgi:chemotaxis signal transduction protein